MAKSKPFKPPLGAICSFAGVGLDVRLSKEGKSTTLKVFNSLNFKAALDRSNRRNAAQLIKWARARALIQGPEQGPFVLTSKGLKVVNKACGWRRRR